jgi:hypothetical protein
MPYGDGTGPAGMGPMTGRAAGYCAGYSMPGFQNPVPGRGALGRRSGGRGGRGWRNMYYATGLPGWARAGMDYPFYRGGVFQAPHYTLPPETTPQQEAEFLKNQASIIQENLKNINERLKELEKPAEEKGR